MAQLLRIGFEHPDLHYEVVYGISDNARAWWDNAAGYAFYALLALLAVDLVLMPALVRRANRDTPPGPLDSLCDESIFLAFLATLVVVTSGSNRNWHAFCPNPVCVSWSRNAVRRPTAAARSN